MKNARKIPEKCLKTHGLKIRVFSGSFQIPPFVRPPFAIVKWEIMGITHCGAIIYDIPLGLGGVVLSGSVARSGASRALSCLESTGCNVFVLQRFVDLSLDKRASALVIGF